MSFTVQDLDAASHNLTRFVKRMAGTLCEQHNMSWVTAPQHRCPSNLEGIQTRFALAIGSGTARPFPILGDASDDTIYTDKKGNYCFRFWHDWLHYKMDASTSIHAELGIAAAHYDRVAHVFGKDSPEALLIYADVAGQIKHWDVYGNFVAHQRDFVYDLVQRGYSPSNDVVILESREG